MLPGHRHLAHANAKIGELSLRCPFATQATNSEEKKANTDRGETPLNNQPDYNISARPPQL